MLLNKHSLHWRFYHASTAREFWNWLVQTELHVITCTYSEVVCTCLIQDGVRAALLYFDFFPMISQVSFPLYLCVPIILSLLICVLQNAVLYILLHFVCPWQRQAICIAANCARSVSVANFSVFAEALPVLSSRLQHQVCGVDCTRILLTNC